MCRWLILLALVSTAALAASERRTQSTELRAVESVTILPPRVEARRLTGDASERMPRFEGKVAVTLAGHAARTLARKRFEVRGAPLPANPEEAARMQAEGESLDAAWKQALARLAAGTDMAEVSIGAAIRPIAARTSSQALLLIDYSARTKAGVHADAAAEFGLHMAGKLGRLAGDSVRGERVEMALIHAESGTILWYASGNNNRLSREGATEAAFAALRSLPARPRRQEVAPGLKDVATVAVVAGHSHIANLATGERAPDLEAAASTTLTDSARREAAKRGYVTALPAASEPDALLAVRFTGIQRDPKLRGPDEQSSIVPAVIATAIVVTVVIAAAASGGSSGIGAPHFGGGGSPADLLPASGVVELTLVDAKNGETLWTGSAASSFADQAVSDAMRTLPRRRTRHAAR